MDYKIEDFTLGILPRPCHNTIMLYKTVIKQKEMFGHNPFTKEICKVGIANKVGHVVSLLNVLFLDISLPNILLLLLYAALLSFQFCSLKCCKLKDVFVQHIRCIWTRQYLTYGKHTIVLYVLFIVTWVQDVFSFHKEYQ